MAFATPALLKGVRVVELGGYWAAPYGAALMADMGAEVIKVESIVHPDMRMPPRLENGKVKLDGIPFFNVVNRNKLGCTINLRHPRGVEMLRKLVAVSDVLIENYSVSARKKLGIDYPDLASDSPQLVYVSLSGFGSEGPFSGLRAYGPTLEAMSGLNSVLGYEGGWPTNVGVGLTDPLGGVYGAVAALAGLHDRRRTGTGQHIDLSQMEGVIGGLAETVITYFMSGTVPRPSGNMSEPGAPSGVYRCKGDDEWVALAVTSEAAWEAFRQVTEIGQLGAEDFATAEARMLNRHRLEGFIESWTSQRTPKDASDALTDAGIIAAPVLHIPEVLTDDHILARGVFTRFAGTLMYSPPFGWLDRNGILERPKIRAGAPVWAQDNDYVFRDLLRLSDAEIDQLVSDRVLV